MGLYKDPQGKDIFKDTSIVATSFSISESESKPSEADVRLRRRIEELENEVKEKNVSTGICDWTRENNPIEQYCHKIEEFTIQNKLFHIQNVIGIV